MTTAKILVVEDENIVATDIKNRLNRLGYAVPAVVNSGEKALKKVEETHPSLVIMDIRLSGDMDGVTAAEKIRSRFQIPVIYLTAYSDETTLQRAKVTEPFGYILKPFQARDLQIAIEMALYKHQMERQLKSREQRLDTIIKSIGDAVLVTDVNGCVQFMNPVAEALTGWNQEEAEGKDLIEVLCLINKETGAATENIAATVMSKGSVLRLLSSCKLISKDGTERPIGDSAAPIRDREGNITGVVLTFQDFTERKQAEERLIRSAFHDQLTQLPNRALFLDRLEQAAQRARRHEDCRFAVLFLDLDDFKTINDRFGHSIGDELLVAIACRLKACLRAVDTVARLGGDEFAVLLEEIREVGDATRVADRIQAALAFPLNISGHEVLTTVSIGIALSTTGYDQPENLLRDADTAMHGAKVQRKARYAVFDGAIRKGSTASLQRLLNPPLTLNSDCLQLFYQPIVSLSTGKITGFEVVRWQHQDYSLFPLDQFIPKAEANGLSGSLTELILRQACHQISDWQRQFPTKAPLTISLNISSTELNTPDLIKHILQILQETQLDASSLQLEITENVLTQVAAASQMIQQLRNLGLQLSVDNFGSSYSLLSYLYRFPINTLKIDPAFVSQIGVEPENWEIVQTILMLAHNLSLNVTAEGIETAQQLAQLRRLNCNYGQGYFFSGPLDSETTAALLASAPQW